MIGFDWQSLTYGRFDTNGLVPPDITPSGPGNACAGTLVHDNVFDARARRHRLICVARKTRRVDRANAGDGKHRDDRLLAHGQEHADRVVNANSKAAQGVGEPPHLL
jgi:hypothetical protein